jgi:hypothetical protein
MGYLHINLAQSACNILTVVMSFGFYECTKLPMGVMPATNIFQSRMVSVFADMGTDKPVPYINDILISAGKTFKEHLVLLEETLTCLGNASFQVNADKSEFFSKALKFLGFVLTPEGYQPTPKCIKAILAFSAPTNIKDVRHFLGVCNFIINHIPGQAALMEPITNSRRKMLSLHGRRNKRQLSN